MPSSACVSDRFAGRASRARAGSSPPARRAPRRCAGRPRVAVPAPPASARRAARNEMPACRTGPCTGSSTSTDMPLLIDLLVLERLVRVAHRRDRDLVGPELVEQVLALHAPDRVADRSSSNAWPPVGFHSRSGGSMPEDLPDDAAVLAPTAGEVHRVHPQAVGALVDARAAARTRSRTTARPGAPGPATAAW